MPWNATYYPSSMKNLPPELRRKAVEIANALLRSGHPEGQAIRIAIASAKRDHGARKRRRRAPRSEAVTPARDELNKASRALLGEDGSARAMRPPPEDASVQDPLGDWPED